MFTPPYLRTREGRRAMSETKQLTNTLLKGLMTDSVADRDYCTDMDTCMESGYYTVSAQRTVNIPEGAYSYGVLLVMKSRSFVSQIYHAHHAANGGNAPDSCLHVRMHHEASGWGPWTKIAGV